MEPLDDSTEQKIKRTSQDIQQEAKCSADPSKDKEFLAVGKVEDIIFGCFQLPTWFCLLNCKKLSFSAILNNASSSRIPLPMTVEEVHKVIAYDDNIGSIKWDSSIR